MKGFYFLLLSLCFSTHVFSQGFLTKATEFFEFEIGKESHDTNHYQTKIVIAPVIAYEPNTSWQVGVGTKLLFKFKDSSPETRTSNLPASITYTLRNQWIVASDYTFFTNDENYLLKGRNHFLKYPISYYGAGIFIPKEEKVEVELHNVLFEPLLLKRVYKKLFIGGGYRYNKVWNVKVAEFGHKNEASNAVIKALSSSSSGLEFAVTIDSRNNVINALNGNLIEFTHGIYDNALGSTHNFTINKLDARKYFRVSDHRLDVIAFQFYSRFTWGDVPLYELSALGGRDLLRGYPEGRFNDKHAVFFQPEYRWQTLDLLGMVFYAGVGDVFSDASKDLSLDRLKYSIGSGIRLKIVESENLNIRIDYGLGFGHSSTTEHNLYLGIAEAF